MKIEQDNPSAYDMPKPSRVIILDDVSHGDSTCAEIINRLGNLMDSPVASMVVTTETLTRRLRKKYDRAIINNRVKPLDLIVAIGQAGQEIAELLELSAPIIRINPTRKVKEDGLPEIVSKTGISFFEEANNALKDLSINLSEISSVGIVDDTIFFGGTINATITAIKKLIPNSNFTALALTYASPFAKVNLQELRVIAGINLRTNQQRYSGINSIDAKDFVENDALPLPNGSSIPFMEENNWMTAWFGKNYQEAYEICKQLQQ